MRQTRWKSFDAFLAELRSAPRHVQLGSQCLRSALDLVGVADDVRRFTAAVNRVLGNDAGRWRLAASLDRSALARIGDGPAPATALIDTSVALYMTGNLAVAMAFELRAARVSRDPVGTILAVRMAVAGCKGQPSLDSSLLLDEGVELAAAIGIGANGTQVVAAACHASSEALLGRSARSPRATPRRRSRVLWPSRRTCGSRPASRRPSAAWRTSGRSQRRSAKP